MRNPRSSSRVSSRAQQRGMSLDELRRAVMRHAGMGELEKLARDAGMRTMYEDGIGKALAGLTTIEEVLRVTEDA